MNKHLNFEIEDGDIVEENPDSQFATGKVRAFSSGESRNETFCTEEALMATAKTIENKPILYNVNKIFDDFNSHADPSNSLIAGFVVPDTIEFIRLPDNRLSLGVEIKIWKRYAPKAMEIFRKDGGKKKVSVEVDLVDSEEMPNGLLDMKNFVYSGICILGDIVTEASPGAQIEMMSFAEENKAYEEALKMEFSNYNNIDLTIPKNVKDNVAIGYSLYKKNNRGATSVSLATANFISKNDKITPEKIRAIKNSFKSDKFKDMAKSPPSDSYITYMMYGGSDGMSWSNELSNELDRQDSIIMSHFNQNMAEGKLIEKEKTDMTEEEKAKMAAEEAEKEKMAAEEAEKEKMAAEEEEKAKMAAEEEEKKKAEQMATDEEAKKKEEEDKEKEEEDKEEKKMSNDANLDVAATLTMLANETDAYSKMVNEEYAKEEKDYAKMFEAVCGKILEMSKENTSLKSFKADVELKQFNYEVETTMKYIEDNTSMPQDKREYLMAESSKFSLADVDTWKNLARSSALDFAKKNEETQDELVFATPWGTKRTVKSSSIWD